MYKSKPQENHNTTGESWGHSGRNLLTPHLPNQKPGRRINKGAQTRSGARFFKLRVIHPNDYGVNTMEQVTMACYYDTCDRGCESAVVVTLLAFWVVLYQIRALVVWSH